MSPRAESGGADSAGRPWRGRSFGPAEASGDDGSAPAALLAAHAAFRAGECGPGRVVDALRGARLLIPLLAELEEAGVNEHGVRVDKSQELSIVTVEGPDGRPVLPVFSSVAALAVWDGRARPVPVDARRVALAAVQEGAQLLVLDPMSETEFAVRRPALWAIGKDEPWTPAGEDPVVARAFERSVASEAAVRGLRLEGGDPDGRMRGPEVTVVLALEPGLDRGELRRLVDGLAESWAADEVLADRVDSLAVRIEDADARDVS